MTNDEMLCAFVLGKEEWLGCLLGIKLGMGELSCHGDDFVGEGVDDLHAVVVDFAKGGKGFLDKGGGVAVFAEVGEEDFPPFGFFDGFEEF